MESFDLELQTEGKASRNQNVESPILSHHQKILVLWLRFTRFEMPPCAL